jgi:ketosteroid isomerase-like protein
LTEPEHSEILQANRAFYDALEKRSFPAMELCWSHSEDVSCIHPGWHRLEGWMDIARSWQAIFSNSRAWKVVEEEERVVASADLAVVYCVERLESVGGQGEPARMQATNVFRKEGRVWKLIHHHASPMPDLEAPEDEESVN